jgi:ubiquinone/menaquinone biosynthesis C-methylase UbiE
VTKTGQQTSLLNSAGLIFGESAPCRGLNVRKRLLHLAGLHGFGGRLALDLGCGKGAYLSELLSHFQVVVGVDVLFENLELSRRNLNGNDSQSISLMQASAENLCLQKESVDTVLLIEVLDHVPSVPNCIREVARVLKRGGLCYVCVPNWLFPLETHPIRIGRTLVSPFWFPFLHRRLATARTFRESDLRREANAVGLQVIGMRTMFPPLERRGGPISRALVDWLDKTVFRAFGSTLLAVMQKD